MPKGNKMNQFLLAQSQRMFQLEAEAERLRTENKILKRENSALKADQNLLLAILSESLGSHTVVIHDDIDLNRAPAFRIEENLGGDIILSLR